VELYYPGCRQGTSSQSRPGSLHYPQAGWWGSPGKWARWSIRGAVLPAGRVDSSPKKTKNLTSARHNKTRQDSSQPHTREHINLKGAMTATLRHVIVYMQFLALVVLEPSTRSQRRHHFRQADQMPRGFGQLRGTSLCEATALQSSACSTWDTAQPKSRSW